MSEAPVARRSERDRTADVLTRAAALEGDDWEAAIDVLAAANRVEPDLDLELALVALRNRCFSRVTATADVGAVPTVPAPLIGPRGLPETTLQELDAGKLRAAILGHGSLLVPGVVSRERSRELAVGIERCFEISAAGAKGVAPSRWWAPFQSAPAESGEPRALPKGVRTWVRAAGGVLLCDSPELQFETLDLYTELGLHAIVEDYLGTRPVLSANKSTLRSVSPEATGGWHQDGAFLGTGIRAVNLWLALTDCGVDAPGLDLVPRRFDRVVETGSADSYFDWAAGDESVRRAAGDAGIIRPEFEAGDLLIFDDLMLHKTATSPDMVHDRHAIELWSFAANAYPSGHVPLVW